MGSSGSSSGVGSDWSCGPLRGPGVVVNYTDFPKS